MYRARTSAYLSAQGATFNPFNYSAESNTRWRLRGRMRPVGIGILGIEGDLYVA